MSNIINTIKNILIPAIKDEVKKTCIDAVEHALYHEPVDLREVIPVPYDPNHKSIRVIGPIVTRY